MVTKKKSTAEQEETKGKVEVGKLKLNKETVKNLTSDQQKRVKGGARPNENDYGSKPYCTCARSNTCTQVV